MKKVLLFSLLAAVILPAPSVSDEVAAWYGGNGCVSGSDSGARIRVGYGDYSFDALYGGAWGLDSHPQSGFCPYTLSGGGCGIGTYTFGYSTTYCAAYGSSANEVFFTDGPWVN